TWRAAESPPVERPRLPWVRRGDPQRSYMGRRRRRRVWEACMSEATEMCTCGGCDHSAHRTNGAHMSNEDGFALSLLLDQDSVTYLQRFRGVGQPERAAQFARYLFWLAGHVETLDAERIGTFALAFIERSMDPAHVTSDLGLPRPPEWG